MPSVVQQHREVFRLSCRMVPSEFVLPKLCWGAAFEKNNVIRLDSSKWQAN